MYHGDLAIARKRRPHLVFDEKNKHAVGQYHAFQGWMQINPAKAYKALGDVGLTYIMLHEGQHMADLTNQPVKYWGIYAMEHVVEYGSALLAVYMTSRVIHEGAIDTVAGGGALLT